MKTQILLITILLGYIFRIYGQGFQKIELDHEIIDGYMIWIPKQTNDRKYPVILSLHSYYEIGGDIENSINIGPANIIKEDNNPQLDFVKDSFLIITPHITKGDFAKRQWYDNTEMLNAIIDSVISNNSGDCKRIYLTGYSRGAHGTWGYLSKYPGKFAAAIPISGFVKPKWGAKEFVKDFCDFKEMPLWIFHNIDDPTVPYENSRLAVDSIENCGGDSFLRLTGVEKKVDISNNSHIFTSYDSDEHSQSNTYLNPLIYKWLLRQNQK